MRNGQIISQAPGFAYSTQINRSQLAPNNPLIVNRWSTANNPPQQTYNNLQSYPSFESNNSGFTQHGNNLPPPYQSSFNMPTLGNQIPMANNGYNNSGFTETKLNNGDVAGPILTPSQENNGVKTA